MTQSKADARPRTKAEVNNLIAGQFLEVKCGPQYRLGSGSYSGRNHVIHIDGQSLVRRAVWKEGGKISLTRVIHPSPEAAEDRSAVEKALDTSPVLAHQKCFQPDNPHPASDRPLHNAPHLASPR